jgi:pyrroline-5-carboxylate reductase
MKRIGIIGFGNMGSALAAGLREGKYELGVSESKADRALLASKKYGLKVYTDKSDLVTASDILVLAVKPQELSRLVEEIGELPVSKRIISIIAGKSMGYIMKNLGVDAMARFMPNLAAREGKALVGIAFSSKAEVSFKGDCMAIASALGWPMEIPESLMPAITGLSGSGIAFVFAFFHAMALGGVKAGIPYPQALEVALRTVEGATEVVRKSGENPVEWLNRVISPAGTTIAGIAALEENGFTYGVMQAVEAAARRAKDLED